MSAQDKAFALMASQAGLLTPEILARAERLRVEKSLDQPIPQVLVGQSLLHPRAVTALLREVIRAHYVCERCAHRLGYDQLADLSHLICTACGGGLIPEKRQGLVSSHTSGVGTLPRPSSERLPAAADPSTQTHSDDSGGFMHPAPAPGWDGKATVVEKGRHQRRERAVVETHVGHVAAGAPPPVPAVEKAAEPARGGDQRTLGEYTLIKELGRGSNGVVYLAKRKGLQRRFALKVLLDAEFADDESVKRFRLEAAIASKLNDPGVVTVFDVGRKGNHHYYAMDYCEGPTLRQRIKEGPLPPREAAEILTKLCRTLSAAHRAGVLHRDLKPANIILSPTHPRITDFGLAQDHSLERSLTKTGDILGTPFYMAPELFRLGAKGLDHRGDIYALGVILYECLSGRRPFSAATPMMLAQLICHEAPAPISAHVPGVPSELESICLQAMSKKPDDRYVNTQEMADDLELFMRGVKPKRRRSTRRRKIELPKVEKRKLAIAGLVAAGVLLPVLAWFGVKSMQTSRRHTQARELLGNPTSTRDDLVRAEGLAEGEPELEARAKEAVRGHDLAARIAEARALLEKDPAPHGEIMTALNQAKELATSDAELIELKALRKKVRAREAASSARALAAERAGFRELVAMAFERAIQDTEDPIERARLELDRLGYYFNHGAFQDVCNRAPPLQGRSDRIGLEADLLCALALYELEQVEEAKAALQKLFKRDPSGPVGIVAGACWRVLEADMSGGLELAQQSKRLDPDYDVALMVEGFCALSTGDVELAKRNLDRLESWVPHRPGVIRLRLSMAATTGSREGILAAIDEAVFLTEPHPPASVLRKRAELYFQLGEQEKALPDLERGLRRNPDHVHMLLMRGVVRQLAGDEEAAAVDLRRAYKVDAEEYEALLQRIQSRRLQRMLLDIAQSKEEVRPAGSMWRGKKYPAMQLGSLPDTVTTALKPRWQAAPGLSREALSSALTSGARASAWYKVEEHLQAAVQAAPSSAIVLLEKTRALVGRSRYAEALEAITEAREAGAPRFELDRLHAEVLLRRGDLREALAGFEALARADPNGLEGSCAAGEAFLLRAEPEKAKAAAEKALSLSPDHVPSLIVHAWSIAGDPQAALNEARHAFSVEGALNERVVLVHTVATIRALMANLGRGRRNPMGGMRLIMETDALFRMTEAAMSRVAICQEVLHSGFFTAMPEIGDWVQTRLTEALRIEPKRALTHVLLGLVQVRSGGDSQRALENWKRAKQLDPQLDLRPWASAFRNAFGRSEDLDALLR